MKSNLWTSSEKEASVHKATREIHIPMFQQSSKGEEHTEHGKEALQVMSFLLMIRETWGYNTESPSPSDRTLGLNNLYSSHRLSEFSYFKILIKRTCQMQRPFL
jgi:hypothetical protein